MSADKKVDVIVRLGVDGDDLDKKLTPSAKKAQSAIDDVAASARKSSPAFNALDDTVNFSAGAFEGFASQIPIVGDALVALGPKGVAAGVAIGAVTFAAVTALKAGAAAAREVAAIGDTADDIGLATDAYQALAFVTAGQRQEQSSLNSILKTASKNLGEVVLGSGEFYSNIKLLNPELVRQVASVDTLETRLNLVAIAYQNATSDTERQQLASRTFGDSNLNLAKSLLSVEGGLDGAIEKAKEFGAVQNDVLIAAAQDAAAKLELADLRITASKQRLGIAWADEAAGMKSAWAGLLNFVAGDGAANLATPIEEQIAKLEGVRQRTLDRVAGRAARDRGGYFGLLDDAAVGDALKRAEGFQEEIDALIKLRDETRKLADERTKRAEDARDLAAVTVAFNRLTEAATTKINQRAEAEKALDDAINKKLITDEKEIARLRAFIAEKYKNVEAIRAGAKALKAFERRAKQVAEVQSRIGDVLAKVAIKEKQLNDLRTAGLRAGDKNVLSLQQISATLRDYERRLNGAAAAEKRLNISFAKSLAPQARYLADKQKMLALQKLANIDAEKFNAILAAREQLYRAEVQAVNDAKEREQFGETLVEAEKRILEALKASEQVIDAKVGLQRKILEALGERIGTADAARYLKEYREDLEKVGKETNKVSRANNDWNQILRRQIRSWKDLKSVALAALQEIITQLVLGKREANGFGGILAAILGGNRGFTPGITAPVGKDFGGGIGDFLAAIFHDGTPGVSKTSPRRPVSTAEVAAAPRLHGGQSRIGDDEVVAVLQVGERVTSRSDSRALVDAINRATARSFDIAGERGGATRVNTSYLTAALATASKIMANSTAPVFAANDRRVGGVNLIVNNNAVGVEVQAEDRGLDAEGQRQIALTIERIVDRKVPAVIGSGGADSAFRQRFGVHPVPGRR